MEKEVIGSYKKKLLEVTKILLNRGVYEYTAGHASVRIPGTDLILIPGHIHPERRTIDSITEEDLSLIDLDGNLVEGRLSPPNEKYIHTEIYKVRKDVGSVVHSHPKVVNALSIAGKEILPISLRSAVFYPKVPIHPFPGEIGTPALGKEFAQFLGEGVAIVQQGHGAITVGADLEKACVITILLEDCAELQWMVMTMGPPRILPEDYLQGRVLAGSQSWEFFSNPWVYYYNKYIARRSDQK
jgi:ribulose-5-phosphate 4-epimerase/fuculose-1-phosphate aldolase